MRKKAIIFDLDGTLLNTLEDLTDSTNFALKYFNYPQRTIKEVCHFIGDGVAKLIERAIPYGLDNKDYNKCLEIFKKHYADNMYNKTSPYNGIVEMLKKLKSKGYKIAVVSNKFDFAVEHLCEKYFPNLIDISAGENEALGIKKKPAPDIILKVLDKFNINCEDAIFVGDSDVDILCAKNSNMDCISVVWGFRDENFLKKHGAKIIIQKPAQLFEILDN
ncbi:HAD family hydrolase [bacterium]|nr:HAD family hydrolase [bacterium]